MAPANRIVQVILVGDCKVKGFGILLKTMDHQGASPLIQGLQCGTDVGRSAHSDVPNHQGNHVAAQGIFQSGGLHIESTSLKSWSIHGMADLPVTFGPQAMSSLGQGHERIISPFGNCGGGHSKKSWRRGGPGIIFLGHGSAPETPER